MIVAIDTLFLSKRFRYTGTGVYLHNLLCECLRIGGSELCGIEFHGFSAPNDDWAANGLVSPILRVHQVRALGLRRLWLLGGMAFNTARVRPDLVFLPTAHHSVPGRCAPIVTTILDAMPKRLPRALPIMPRCCMR